MTKLAASTDRWTEAIVRIGYVTKESVTNLRRNVLMTVATVLTVAISLTLVGFALGLRSGVGNATGRFRSGVQLEIFLKPEVTDAQIAAVRTELEGSPDIAEVMYIDRDEALRRFREAFANRPEYTGVLREAKDMPPSFEVKPARAELLQTIADGYENREEVYRVRYPAALIDELLRFFGGLQGAILGIAGLLAIAAVLLVLNTIRVAIFARRREVAVMKLVGATNWFIRLPFMLEGLLQGLFGGVLAFGLLFSGYRVGRGYVRDIPLLAQFTPSSEQVLTAGVAVLIAGAVVGAIGSAIAVSRFLDV